MVSRLTMEQSLSRRRFLVRSAWATCVAGVSLIRATVASQPVSTQRLDPRDLLIYRGPGGERIRVRSIDDWQKRRAEILRGMQEIMGPLPGRAKRGALDPQTEEEVDRGSYVRRLLTYASEPGSRVPTYLLVPKAALQEGAKTPAVLCLHPTDDQLGHKVIVGLGGKANRQYAHELAERGFVTLAPAYPLLANYQPDLGALGYESGTMKAVWDNIRGLDLLETLPFVKAGAYGAIGHSLGGHSAVFTAAFDERITAIVTSCGLDSFLDYYGGNPAVWQAGKGWTSTRYMPRLARYAGRLAEIPFDFHELIAALAPRTCLISAPMADSNFQWKSVAELSKAARTVFELHGVPGNLQVQHPDCGHDFPEATRESAYALLDRVLRPPR
jgi:dienelactone hydrolase